MDRSRGNPIFTGDVPSEPSTSRKKARRSLRFLRLLRRQPTPHPSVDTSMVPFVVVIPATPQSAIKGGSMADAINGRGYPHGRDSPGLRVNPNRLSPKKHKFGQDPLAIKMKFTTDSDSGISDTENLVISQSISSNTIDSSENSEGSFDNGKSRTRVCSMHYRRAENGEFLRELAKLREKLVASRQRLWSNVENRSTTPIDPGRRHLRSTISSTRRRCSRNHILTNGSIRYQSPPPIYDLLGSSTPSVIDVEASNFFDHVTLIADHE